MGLGTVQADPRWSTQIHHSPGRVLWLKGYYDGSVTFVDPSKQVPELDYGLAGYVDCDKNTGYFNYTGVGTSW